MDAQEHDLSPQHLLTAVKRLSLPELERFVQQVLAVHAARRAPHRSADDTVLLTRIAQRLPDDQRTQLQQLMTKRDAEGLTTAEYAAFTVLTDQLEALQADRLAALAALAQRRGTTLADVLAQLDVHFPDHD